GRSTAIHVLEDLGVYCVDNLPPALAPGLVDLAERAEEPELLRRIGLGVDVRTGSFLHGAGATIDSLADKGHEVDVLFLDCADAVLVRRFSETRRPHPLAPGGALLGAIQKERERLGELRERASHVVDTTQYSVHDLRRALVDWLGRLEGGPGSARRAMVTRLTSFGFKYGIPVDADLVFDLRYLPNPHFVPALRPKTGLDEEVSSFVLDTEEAKELLSDLEPLLAHTLPRYEREGKAYLTIAIGCTGGKHRSVAMTEELARRLRGAGRDVVVAHRDVTRGRPAR
ncbi:MAG: RNase adapter RapZ, partial [Myxococcota bacterium]